MELSYSSFQQEFHDDDLSHNIFLDEVANL